MEDINTQLSVGSYNGELTRATQESAGYDMHAANDEDIVIAPGKFKLIPTGVRVKINKGYWGNIRARSGLAVKFGITTGAGVVDSDYRGEVGVVLFNFGENEFIVKKNDRIAQLIIERCYTITPTNDEITNDNIHTGFGSTGY